MDDKQSMKPFEKWQIRITSTQTIILLLTLIAAVYIGLKQTLINEQLLNLSYYPSMEVAYTNSNHRLQLYNKSRQNIWVWGTQLENKTPANIKGQPRLVTPGGSYYIIGDRLERLALKKVGKNGEIYLPFNVFIETANKTKYTVQNKLFCQVKDSKVEIHSQTLAIVQEDWSKYLVPD
jgi:hypothetical protein